MAAGVFWALMATIALAPLPFGANRPWAWSALSLAVGVLLVLWAWAAIGDARQVRIPWRLHGPATALFGAVAAWLLLQSLPWAPSGLDHPLWADAAAALDRPLAAAPGLDPAAARDGLMRLVCYAGVFWLAMQFGRDPRHARRTLWAVTVAGFAYAVYGLAIDLGGYGTILGYDKWTYRDSLTSTFVNRNNYATYAGLCLLAALGLLVVRVRESIAHVAPSARAMLRSVDQLGLDVFFLILACFVMATALALTHSRGGLFATGFGVVVLLAVLTARGGSRRWLTLAVAATMAVAAVAVLEISAGGTIERMAHLAEDQLGRSQVYGVTIRAIAERPAIGTGLGGFQGTFHMFRDATIPWTSPVYDKAHNTYLEMALEAGLVAAAVLAVLLAGIAVALLGGALRRRREAIYPAVGAAAIGLVGIHSAMDFSIQIPAVAVTLAALAGVAFAQCWPTRSVARD